MAFDIEGARREGYSDREIADHLAKGRKFDIEGARKEGYSDGDIIGHLSKSRPAPQPKAAEKPNIFRRAVDQVKAPFEAAMSLGSGMVAQPLSGIAGLAMEALGGSGADTVRGVQEALTYQPRGEPGRRLVDIASYPFQKMEEAAHSAGGVVTDYAGPEAGTAANVSLQAIPAVFLGGLSRLRGARAPAAAPQPTLPPPQAQQPALPAPAAARAALGEQLPVPVRYTEGQALRDPEKLRRETVLAETKEGKPIRELHEEHNRALIENLEVLKGASGAKAVDLEGVGKKVAGEGGKGQAPGAITLAERKSANNVDSLYLKARKAGEMETKIDVQPILDTVKENPPAKAMLEAQLKALDIDGPPTLNQLERVRKRAVTVARTSSDGTMRHDAGELIKAIDNGTPESAGGAAYKAARAARKEHAMQFEEPRAISKLIGEKTRTDREVALENVWSQTVQKGSIADLDRVRSQLLHSPDRVTRDSGRKAWREIVGQTVEHIKTEATKGVAQDASGNVVLNPGALKKAVDAIGERKLDILLGPSSAQKLRNIVQVAQDVKTLPPYRGGSTTVPNTLALRLFDVLDKAAKYVPVFSDTARGAVGVLKGATEKGVAKREVAHALRDPASQTQGRPAPPGNPVSLADLAARVSPVAPSALAQRELRRE